MKYRIIITYESKITSHVEAESEEEAIKQAREETEWSEIGMKAETVSEKAHLKSAE